MFVITSWILIWDKKVQYVVKTQFDCTYKVWNGQMSDCKPIKVSFKGIKRSDNVSNKKFTYNLIKIIPIAFLFTYIASAIWIVNKA